MGQPLLLGKESFTPETCEQGSVSARIPQSDRMGRHAKIPAASWCQGHINTSWERSEKFICLYHVSLGVFCATLERRQCLPVLRGCGVPLKRLLDMLIFSIEGTIPLEKITLSEGVTSRQKSLANFFLQVLDSYIAKKGRPAMPSVPLGLSKLLWCLRSNSLKMPHWK